MNKIYKLLLVGVVIATFTSCTYTFPEDEVSTAGTADFTKVVTVGNSLSAGYMNGALYDAGQASSFPNIIGQQIYANGGGVFNQPDINSVNGYYTEAGGVIYGRLILKGDLTPEGVVNPAPTPIGLGDAITAFGGDKAALNNFGVPGLRVIDADAPGYGTVNAYFGRFASDPTTVSVLDDAVAANGTFFIYWLGGNDVLGYATQGATGSEDGTNTNDMSPVGLFGDQFNAAITALTANGKGIIANVPSIQDIPHFTTVPWNAIPMDAATADFVNGNYAPYNGGLDAMVGNQLITQEEADLRYIIFKEGQNGAVIFDTELTDLTSYNPALVSMRMANSNDLFTLSAGAVLGKPVDAPVGVAVPLAEVYTLTLANQEAIANRTADFNAVIAATVSSNSSNLALLDIHTIFADFAQNGTFINESPMSASISPPFGAFSLDGVHPNERGSAYVASLFIDKINESFGSNIPNINPNDYSGNELPQPK